MKKYMMILLAGSMAACSPGRPALATHAGADPAALPPAQLAAEMEAALSNYAALQDFYLSRKTSLKREPSALDKQWATGAVAAESEALSRLLPQDDRLLKGAAPDSAAGKGRTYHVSLALFNMDDKDAGAWELARLRANLASELLSLYRALSAPVPDQRETARLHENFARAKAELEQACATSRPVLAPHAGAAPAALSQAQLVTEMEASLSNFFALQDFYLSRKTLLKPEPSAMDKQWATDAVAAESGVLSRLLPQGDRMLKGAAPERAGEKKRTYDLSLALFGLGEGDDQVWETARLRANLSSELLSLYRALSAPVPDQRETARLRDNVAKAKAELEQAASAAKSPAAAPK